MISICQHCYGEKENKGEKESLKSDMSVIFTKESCILYNYFLLFPHYLKLKFKLKENTVPCTIFLDFILTRNLSTERSLYNLLLV